MQAVDTLTALAESEGGHVTEIHQWQEGGYDRAQLTLRIPPDQFGKTLSAVRAFAVRVESERVASQDVSEEFADLSAQLINLQATESELRELLSAIRERTQRASDVLEIHAKVMQIRGEIEQVEGRRLYLQNMVAFSTIHLEIFPQLAPAPSVRLWDPLRTATQAGKALMVRLRGLANLLIWALVFFVPLTVVFGAPVVVAWRLYERWTLKKNQYPD
jgi:hypothetical protein